MVWAAILFGTLLALGVVLWADFDRHVDLELEMSVGIAAFAAGVGVASFVVPRWLYANAVRKLALPVVAVPRPDVVPGDYRSGAATDRVFRDPVAAQAALVAAFRAPCIVGLALAEAISFLGLVLAQGRFAPSSYALPFFAVSWVLLGVQYPKASRVMDPAHRIYALQS